MSKLHARLAQAVMAVQFISFFFFELHWNLLEGI
jgi:hypothetical protein